MIEICIVFAIFSLIMEVVSKPYTKKIENATTLEEALKFRRRLRFLRYGLTILFILLYIGPSLYIVPDVGYWINGKGKYAVEGILVYLIVQKGFKKLTGNISSLSKAGFLVKCHKFALFLRGFEDDVYGLDDYNLISKERFSELSFMENLQQYLPACAIGMTKESDAPFGARRVYVSDESWKEDVRDLMNRANLKFVLLNDRPSCIWEIEQSADVLNKTCFLVEDIDKYNSIRNQLSGEIDFPDASKMDVTVPFALRLVDIPVRIKSENGLERPDKIIAIAQKFENSKDGYEELLSILIEGKSAKEKKVPSFVMKIFYYLIAIVILLIANVRISTFLLNSFGTEDLVLRCFMTMLLYIIEWLVYMVVKVSWKTRKAKE